MYKERKVDGKVQLKGSKIHSILYLFRAWHKAGGPGCEFLYGSGFLV